ncbi:hypothetical protein FBU30_008171, partial [Linnemannia zychae]
MITNNKEPATGTTAPPSLPSTQAATVRPLVARPYSQLLLTVEPDYFVLQPHIPASTDAKSVVSRPSSDLVRILFKTNDIISKEETLEQMNEKLAEEANEAEVRKHPTKGPIDLSAMAEENPRRVSFISADSYMRSDSAKDYIIYGCIGLLNLYTGPHFIVITSVKSLGDIEDKPVFAINKVAVLPMDPHEAVSILDRLAQQYDCSLGPLLNIEQATKQAAMRQLETNLDTVDVQLVSPAPVKSPKFRLSFLGIKPDRDQQSTTSSSHNSPGQLIQTNQGSDINIAPGKNKRITFDIPGSVSANALSKNEDIEKNKALSQEKLPAPPSSPPLSPTRSSPGFLSKLLDKKSRAKPIGTDIPIANTVLGNPSQEFSQGTIQATTAQLSSEVQTGNGIEASSKSISSERPHFESRSPSTLEVAERFVTESTKQLADWGEEAMSGVLKSTKSFSIMKATADPTEVEPAIDATTEIGLSEEEHDRNRMFDRRIIREFSSIFGTGFYFSTDFNLLTSMQKRSDFAKTASIDELPLWKQVDSRFWWNEHLLQEFLEIEPVSLFSVNRANNIAIMLSRIKMTYPDIRIALLEILDDKLSIENLKAIKQYVPTGDEIELIKEFDGDFETLGPAEKFYREIYDIPRLSERVSSMIFRRRLEIDVSELKPEMDVLRLTIEELHNSRRLKSLLKTVLLIGNHLNATSFRGNAYGFQLDALLKVSSTIRQIRDTKGADNVKPGASTLLHYLAKSIHAKDPNLLKFLDEVPHLEAAARISVPTLMNSVNSLVAGMNQIQEEIRVLRHIRISPANDQFIEVMEKFTEANKEGIQKMVELGQGLEQDLKKLLSFYGEDPVNTKPEEFFGMLVSFSAMLQKSQLENEAMAKKLLAKANQQSRPKGVGSNGGTALSVANIRDGHLDDAIRELRS